MDSTNCHCSVVVCIVHECQEIEQLLNNLHEDIKLPFNILEFDHLASDDRLLQSNPRSHAVCLFQKEDTDFQSTLKRHFETSPWQLDHVIEGSLTKRPQKIAQQEFYSCSEDMPLMSVSSVHYGKEHVRFHINVENFYAMKKFYEGLTDRKAKDCGPDFCFLTIYSREEFDVQIGLKRNLAVLPMRSSSFGLKFEIQSVSPMFKYLATSFDSTSNACYVLKDPDGNDVIKERSYSRSVHTHQELANEGDENNNFERKMLESSLNSGIKKQMWHKYEYSEYALFPKEAMPLSDRLNGNHEEDEPKSEHFLNHDLKHKDEHITYV